MIDNERQCDFEFCQTLCTYVFVESEVQLQNTFFLISELEFFPALVYIFKVRKLSHFFRRMNHFTELY